MLLILTMISCGKEAQYADFVDTSIGVTDKRASNCVIGPQLPYGSINPSPQTEKGDTDGYHPEYPIRGFGQLHVSGTGWSSYGHFLISPMTGLSVGLADHDSDHSADITRPYLYKTHLDRYGIDVEVAPSHYSAIYRFTFPQSEESVLLFDAAHSVVGDIATYMSGDVLENEIDVDPETNTVRMRLRFDGGWPEGAYDLYCLCRYDADAVETGVWEGEDVFAGQSHIEKNTEGVHRGAYCRFDTRKNQQVRLKVSLSFTSFEKAEEFMNDEIPGFNFDKVVREGIKAWDEKLSSVKVESLSDKDRTIFYSGLYRVFTLARDRSKDNSKWESDMPFWDDNYAFWDTFRTAYPLLTLIDELAMRDNINAMIDRFLHNGCVYDGFIAGRDRKPEQGGNDVDHVIVDAFLKGVKGVDWHEAYKIVKHNADNRRIGHLKWFENAENAPEAFMYQENGWIPYRVMSTSQSLEFSYNDYSAALMAKALGYEEDYKRYETRSHQWVNLWNPELENRGYKGFMDARNADGTFEFVRADKMGGSWTSPFYEGSAWTYSYYVPHDFDLLIKLMGGKDAFVERLEYGFRNRLVKYDNEPGFLAPRAFAHAGRPDLASYWVHDTMDKGFDLSGYPGNDDTGSMGSWYVFCYLGFFPNAGQDYYYINAPRCTSAEIRLAEGKILKIKADAGEDRVYVKSVKINGKPWNRPFFRHSDIAEGGLIEFELSDVPTDWGQADVPEKAEVIDLISKVNGYWQKSNSPEVRSFWDNAAYHTGNMEVYSLLKDAGFLEYTLRWAEHNDWKGATSEDKSAWRYRPYGEEPEFVMFGDWQTCFQVYADLYKMEPDEKKIARAIEVMEYQMSTPQNDYWWWSDGLYMAMPVMTRLYSITKNPLYLDKMYEYFKYAQSIMYDQETGLFYRDAKYVYPQHKSGNGGKDFWSRGDGWVLAAFARVFQDLPVDDEHREEYLEVFRKMASSVKDCQQPEGYWTRSMLDKDFAPGPETSGTAFFTYGLLWGINNGILDRDEYWPSVERAWNYLVNVALQPDGRLGYVQPIGERAIPGQVLDIDSTANFGVGAFLLAACEMARFAESY